MAKIIIVNPGSASKKYALFDNEAILKAHYEKDVNDYKLTTSVRIAEEVKITKKTYTNASQHFLDLLKNHGLEDKIKGIAIRVVSPGTFFQKDRIVTKEYISNLKKTQMKIKRQQIYNFKGC